MISDKAIEWSLVSGTRSAASHFVISPFDGVAVVAAGCSLKLTHQWKRNTAAASSSSLATVLLIRASLRESEQEREKPEAFPSTKSMRRCHLLLQLAC